MLLVLEYIDLLFLIFSIIIVVLVIRKKIKRNRKGEPKSSFSIEFITAWGIRWGGIVSAIIVITCGWLITLKVTTDQEKYMKQELRSQTVKLVHSFHPQQISRLTFTKRDKEKPIYERIKNQIRNYAFFSGLDGIYTLKKRGNNFFFGPESFMPGDPMHSPPGTKYLHPPTVLSRVFSESKILITDPYEDEYGSFVSCFAPVMNFEGDKVLMVVGIDIPFSTWSYHKNKVKILPLSITLFLLLLILVGFRYSNGKKRNNTLPSNTVRYWEGILALLAGIIISLYIANIYSKESKRYKEAVFSQSTTSKAAAFARSMDMAKHSLKGLAMLFSVSENVTNSEFNEYVDQIVDYPFISSAKWIELNRDESFYLRYCYPENSLNGSLGEYKVSEDTLRFGAILETLYTNFVSASSTYEVQDKRLVDVFLTTRNVEAEVNGLVSMTIDLDALTRSLLIDKTINDNYYDISVRQISNNDLKEGAEEKGFIDVLEKKGGTVSFEFLDFFFGKVYLVTVTAGSGFYEVFVGSDFWTPLSTGIIITLLITIFVIIMINRKLILEKEIENHISNLYISEERFKSLFSNMLEGVAFHQLIYNNDNVPVSYRIEDVNNAFEKLLGLDRQSVIGKEAMEVYSELPPYFEKYIEAVDEQKAFVFEAYSEIHHKYFEISVAPWGKKGFATIFSDITKRREAENRLRKSEERYRLISENAGDLIWVYDPNVEKFNYVSPSVKKLTGFSYEELIGKNLEFILSEESYSEAKSRLPLRIARFGTGEEEMRVEKTHVRIREKSGGFTPLEVITTLLLNDENVVTGILGVGRDISDRLAAEKALKKSEEKYRLLVENQSDLVVKVDREGYLLYVSPSYCKLFARSEEELLNKKFMPLVHPDDRASTEKAMQKLADPPHSVLIEQRAMTRDGWKWLAWNDTAVLNEQGEIVEIIGVGRDVTGRKMAEKALQESREMLERQNEEYASLNEEYLSMNEELTSINEDLSTAIERAEESEKLKTAFLQNMSHEIRTPLNSIIGFSEMLGMDYLTDEDRKDFTTIIVNSSRQLLDLVNDILTISAIETRQEKTKLSSVNINDMVSELYAVFRPKAKEKGISLKLEKPLNNGLAVLLTDELKLKQILINLLGNALKFTDEGFVEYGYELRKETRIVFYVKDTGVGIPPRMQNRIFDRFMQADNNIKGHYGGTGLGLAICKGHIEMLGGEIWLESTPGVGSIFYFTLPIVTNDEF